MGSRSAIEFPEPRETRLAELQRKYKYSMCLLVDEISMIGQGFMGQLAHACSGVFNGGRFSDQSGEVEWGGLGIVLFFGDFCQLPPVRDPGGVLFGSKPCTNPVTKYGLRAFRSLHRKYILTEPVRQAKDSVLYEQLQFARNAVWDSISTRFWNRRQRLHLPVCTLTICVVQRWSSNCLVVCTGPQAVRRYDPSITRSHLLQKRRNQG